jgi:hypothetical protein
MVRFIIEIEEVSDEPNAVNVLIKTDKQQPTPLEEALAQRISPHLRALPGASSSDAAPNE